MRNTLRLHHELLDFVPAWHIAAIDIRTDMHTIPHRTNRRSQKSI